MKNYLISLEIASTKVSLNELREKIGITGDDTSWSKGDIFRCRPREKTIWRVKSETSKAALIETHIKKMMPIFNSIKKVRHDLPEKCEVVLRIGFMFKNPVARFLIPESVIEAVNSIDAIIEVSAYPMFYK